MIKHFRVTFGVENGIVAGIVDYTAVGEQNIGRVATTAAGISDDREAEEISEINKKGKPNLNKVVFIAIGSGKTNQLNILYSGRAAGCNKKSLIPDKLKAIKTVKELTAGNSKNCCAGLGSKLAIAATAEENSLATSHS